MSDEQPKPENTEPVKMATCIWCHRSLPASQIKTVQGRRLCARCAGTFHADPDDVE